MDVFRDEIDILINTQCTDSVKGPSKNVNIFMSVQTVHFFRPPSPPL